MASPRMQRVQRLGRTPFLVLVMLAALLAASPLQAGEVTQRIGSYLANADWVTSEGGAQKPAVLIVHGTMGHKDMELIQQAQELLQENGYDSLAINLTLNRDNRHGFMPCDVPQTHRHEDALDEIAAWADWLKKQGRHQLILLGHSRGGLQVAQYQAARHDPAVLALALVAPMANRNPSGDTDSHHNPVAKGKEGTRFLHCEKAPQVAPATRKSYARSGGQSLQQALQQVHVPVDVFVGSEDRSEGVIRLSELADKPELKHVKGHLVDGADHFFRDLYLDDVIEALVNRWSQLNADKNAIHAVMSQQQTAWNSGDIAGFMDGYARSPALRFASGDTITRGWQATFDRYRKNYSQRGENGKKPMGRLAFELLEIRHPAPDFATVFGAWRLDTAHQATNKAAGKAEAMVENKPSPHGLFTLFWQKHDGRWRIVADHTSSAH
jgi:dienelactone hydrolase